MQGTVPLRMDEIQQFPKEEMQNDKLTLEKRFFF